MNTSKAVAVGRKTRGWVYEVAKHISSGSNIGEEGVGGVLKKMQILSLHGRNAWKLFKSFTFSEWLSYLRKF